MSRAHLVFERAQGITHLRRQFAAYPFHLTRPFHMDAARPDLATLYLQSSSGGVYRGEALELEAAFGDGAAAEITTQAASLVRDAKNSTSSLEVRMRLAPASLALYTPDLSILFPGAAFSSRLNVVMEEGAKAVLVDGFCLSPQQGGTARPGFYESGFSVTDKNGATLVQESGKITLSSLGSAASPLGPFAASASVYVLNADIDRKQLCALVESQSCMAGISALPNNAGIALRVLAMDGQALYSGLQAARAYCFHALTGVHSAPRRK